MGLIIPDRGQMGKTARVVRNRRFWRTVCQNLVSDPQSFLCLLTIATPKAALDCCVIFGELPFPET
jgi:hypothetical protein